MADRKQDYDYSIKLVLVGDVGVGKTTFLNTFIDGKFSRRSTFDVRGSREKFLQRNDKKIRLQIWDTAGQERYRSLTSSYYRGAHGCLIMFDVTKMSSFENVTRWKRDIQQYCCQDDLGIILVGTKSHEPERKVKQESAESFAKAANIPYMEVSSETDITSVEAVFNKLIDMVTDKAQSSRSLTSPLIVHKHHKPSVKIRCSC